jgi:CNT family concentrative nucleoside transporter
VDLPAVQEQLLAGQAVVVDQAQNISVVGANLDKGLVQITSEPLSLSRILGWLFAPIAFIMGVPWREATVIGDLLGQKLVLTEFVAYINLGSVVQSPTVMISERSAVIASYALCGFANFASIGIQLGGIGGIAPKRMSDLASLGFKAMFCGVIAACMTGAIAGVML